MVEPSTIIAFALIVVVAAMIALTLIEHKLRKKLTYEVKTTDIFKKKIALIERSLYKPEQAALMLDTFARDFFYEEENLPREVSISERVEYFQNKDAQVTNFYRGLQDALYSGEPLQKENIRMLIHEFERIVLKKRTFEVKTTAPSVVQQPVQSPPSQESPFMASFPMQPVHHHRKKEHPAHARIHAVDNLDRIKKKIAHKKTHHHGNPIK